MRKFALTIILVLFTAIVVQPVMAQGTILDIAEGNEDLSYLVLAVEAADPAVAETLSSAGNYTVFAPNNVAFENLASFLEVDLETLLTNSDIVTDILLYHVVEGELSSAQIQAQYDGAVLPTLLPGAFVNLDLADDSDDILVNDVVEIVTADVTASNGVVHVINDVLLNRVITRKIDDTDFAAIASEPATEETPEPDAESTEEATTDEEVITNELDDVISNDDQFQLLLDAVNAADDSVFDALGSIGPFTLLAPSNQAMRDLLATIGVRSVESIDQDILTEILLYHVLIGEYAAEDVLELDDTSVLTALAGNAIYFTVSEDGDVRLNRLVDIIETDIEADNGVIHIIDGVLLPQSAVDEFFGD